MGPEGEVSFSTLSLRTCEHLPYDWMGDTRELPDPGIQPAFILPRHSQSPAPRSRFPYFCLQERGTPSSLNFKKQT